MGSSPGNLASVLATAPQYQAFQNAGGANYPGGYSAWVAANPPTTNTSTASIPGVLPPPAAMQAPAAGVGDPTTGNASAAGGGASSMTPPVSSPATAMPNAPAPLTQIINGQTGQGQQAFAQNADGSYQLQPFDPWAWAQKNQSQFRGLS